MAAAAFFDVDGTLTRSDIFRDHLRFRTETRPGALTGGWLATAPLRAAWLLALDRWSRSESNRAVYRCYQGFTPDELRDWAWRFQSRHGLARTFPRSLSLLQRHASLGHRIVFVTGSLHELIEPLARRLEPLLPGDARIRVEAVSLTVEDGRFTGELHQEPLSGEQKAERARLVADEEGLDLRACHAYGDSIADAELLETVGRPAAVNACSRLRRLALERGWPVLETREGARA